jgi:hypothetical protein
MHGEKNMCAAEETGKTPNPQEDAAREKLAPPLPSPDLGALIQMFFMQGLIAAGKIPSPVTRKYETDPNMAKYHVELLELLLEKTQNNRTREEEDLLDEALHNMRLAYLDISKPK